MIEMLVDALLTRSISSSSMQLPTGAPVSTGSTAELTKGIDE
jgi:hypothetical protein